ncbi:hypothetical protein QF023_001178 [Chryseobacterium sp. SLBN-27]|uniref:hypothetical protein n=1 Tax=Chryseobacterium sp. SLBN-27 TaxID=3042287 RepID=UPI002854F7AC|nr:hypothetical protein [Chryseobacterium sp. SLBN-27]
MEFGLSKRFKVNSELKLFDGNISKVSNIQKLSKTTEVYNLEVLDNHNYYISQNKILVHNNCEWKSVLHPGTLEKTIEKTWGKMRWIPLITL